MSGGGINWELNYYCEMHAGGTGICISFFFKEYIYETQYNSFRELWKLGNMHIISVIFFSNDPFPLHICEC